jgi:bifunctional UDP-N-acetylglucosamine pyrophosphorylase/glucosamine-1-phosphate N-acetyltransferase
MSKRPVAAIILAAGKGTRMKSDLHKVLHPIAGKPMLMHLLASVDVLAPAHKVVVVGSGKEQLEAALGGTGCALAVQEPQLGTGHAVQQAQAALAGFDGDVLILYGDVPLVSAGTMQRMLDRLNEADKPAAVVLGFRPDDPGTYGRIVSDDGRTIGKMVEVKDASAAERAIGLCNSGLMAVRASDLFALLAEVGNDNAAGEYYLPDIVMIAGKQGRTSAVIETAADEVTGVNSRAELAAMEAKWQDRRRQQAMDDGATLIAPETAWFAHDTVIGRDVVIEPNVFFGPGVTIADGVTVHGFSHIEGATIGIGAQVGPFARLRPGAVLEEKSKVGNFVEMKKARLGKGAKANHLTYLGDADVGAGANVGAGTITCNYDGFLKYRTEIGAGAFIGSNSALVAPVTIGEGAIVAAGSVVTADVHADALVIARGSQEVKPNWAKRFREVMTAKKAERK